MSALVFRRNASRPPLALDLSRLLAGFVRLR
jgi:hypothetical protein